MKHIVALSIKKQLFLNVLITLLFQSVSKRNFLKLIKALIILYVADVKNLKRTCISVCVLKQNVVYLQNTNLSHLLF